MIEKFSIVKTLQAMKDAHVVVVVVDAREGIVEQDLHLMAMRWKLGVPWSLRSINGTT